MTDTHAHTWTRTDEQEHYTCTDCTETCPACMECEKPVGSSLLICRHCLAYWKRIIEQTDYATGWMPWTPEAGPRPVRAATYGGKRVKGTGAGHSTAIQSGDVLNVAEQWARLWHSYVGDAAPRNPFVYLADHLLWATHNATASDWSTFKSDMKQCHAAARSAAALAPERMQWPCVYCGAVAVRDRADKRGEYRTQGLADEVRCTGCGITWPTAKDFEFASRTHMRAIPESWPEMTVTLDEAAKAIWPNVPASTIYTGVARDRAKHEEYLRDLDTYPERLAAWTRYCEDLDPEGWPTAPKPPRDYERQIPERGYDTDGTPLYLVADLTKLIERRLDPNRRGPKTRDTPIDRA